MVSINVNLIVSKLMDVAVAVMVAMVASVATVAAASDFSIASDINSDVAAHGVKRLSDF